MNLTINHKVVTAAGMLAALTMTSLVIANFWFYAPPNPEAQSRPVTLGAKPSAHFMNPGKWGRPYGL